MDNNSYLSLLPQNDHTRSYLLLKQTVLNYTQLGLIFQCKIIDTLIPSVGAMESV